MLFLEVNNDKGPVVSEVKRPKHKFRITFPSFANTRFCTSLIALPPNPDIHVEIYNEVSSDSERREEAKQIILAWPKLIYSDSDGGF